MKVFKDEQSKRGEKVFTGTIVAFDKETEYYRIVYDDEDEEDESRTNIISSYLYAADFNRTFERSKLSRETLQKFCNV